MNIHSADIVIVGAGPVGLMCGYLAQLCGIDAVVVDQSTEPLKVGRADAFNARSLQLLELVGLFAELYPLGKTCNTLSVWENGEFISRQSSWWDELEGCFHKHFLMLGQPHLEKLLDEKLKELQAPVWRSVVVENIELNEAGCLTSLTNGKQIRSKYIIGADGSRSFVRNHFKIPFNIIRPQIIWAVIDGVIETNFPKASEIIIFQTDTSEVAWIPREGQIDRFYIRMDIKNFSFAAVIDKINRAIQPYELSFKEIIWYSQFSVKESVAENFFVKERIFLAGDACHVHSVNGGQGLNTGLADAFNLIWKLNMVIMHKAAPQLLLSYEHERQPVAKSVIESSGALVRATKYSAKGTHARDYAKIIKERSGNVTGMGIRYGTNGLSGTRLFDCEIFKGASQTRLYSLLNYTHYTLLIFGESDASLNLPEFIKVMKISSKQSSQNYWTNSTQYKNKAILVRPDSYIELVIPLNKISAVYS